MSGAGLQVRRARAQHHPRRRRRRDPERRADASGRVAVSVVMKFGGTSVADPDAISRLIGIVRQQQTKTDSAPLVVVSALAGVTDRLVAVAQLAEDGASEKAAAELQQLLDRHL